MVRGLDMCLLGINDGAHKWSRSHQVLPCSDNGSFLSGMQFPFQLNRLTADSVSGFISLYFVCLHLCLSSQSCPSCCSSWSPLPPAWHGRLPPPAALAGILCSPSPSFCECFFSYVTFPCRLDLHAFHFCSANSSHIRDFCSHWTIAFRREGTKSFLSCGAGDPGWSQH